MSIINEDETRKKWIATQSILAKAFRGELT